MHKVTQDCYSEPPDGHIKDTPSLYGGHIKLGKGVKTIRNGMLEDSKILKEEIR